MCEKPKLEQATQREIGRFYEDFEVDETIPHHWGRTLNKGDNSRFTTLRMNTNPIHFNREFAEDQGHMSEVIDPLLVFNTVLGLSVEDLSERDTLFLGVEDCTLHKQVSPGVTLTAESKVLEKRGSDSRPNYGIVTWHTFGYDATEELVIDYKRTNMVPRKEHGAE